MDSRLSRIPLEESIEESITSDHGDETASVLPWDRFSNWIHCICIVTFDLEVGQALEVRHTNRFTSLLPQGYRVLECFLPKLLHK